MICDVHVHLPSPGWPEHKSFFSTQKAAIEYLRVAGVRQAVFNTWQGVYARTARDIHAANRAALRLAKANPDFLYPSAIIHPDFPVESADWLKTYFGMGFKWVGELLPRRSMNNPYSDAKFLRLARWCMEYGQVLHLHYHPDILQLARRRPECRIVTAHIPDQTDLEKMSKHANIWLDIAGMKGGLCIGALERAVKTMGIDRVLFGTDFDGYEPRAFIERVRATLPARLDQTKIFWANARWLIDASS